jgi:hypothetical protein
LKDKIVKKKKFEKKRPKIFEDQNKKELGFSLLIAIVKKPSPLEYVN